MGMNLGCMLYLQKKGLLTKAKNRILDIGPQNVYFCTEAQIREFVRDQGAEPHEDVLDAEAKRLAYFSTPRPDETTTLFSEITELASVDYHAFDICPAFKTDILDLNFEYLPEKFIEKFDVVLNFGTTEHVFNQWNSFEVMHDATAVDGIIYCVLPASGYLDHGYYCYTPIFFKDMAAANGYEIVDLFFALAGLNDVTSLGIDVRDDTRFLESNSGTLPDGFSRVPNFNVHAVMRKTRSGPFRCGLEVATAHSALNSDVASRYDDPEHKFPLPRRAVAELDRLTKERDQLALERDSVRAKVTGDLVVANRRIDAMLASTSWRIGQILVKPFALLKRLASGRA